MPLAANRLCLVCALALGALCAVAAASAGDGAGHPSFVVGPDTDTPFVADHYGLNVAILDDGSFALAGTTTVITPDPSQGYPQFETATYSPAGQRLASFVPRPPADTGSIGSLGEQYFVTWQRFPEGLIAKGHTLATVLNDRGTQDGPRVHWPNSDVEFYYQYYRYGSGPRWRFVPVRYETRGVDRFGEPIQVPVVQVYTQAGVPLGPPVRLAPVDELINIEDLAMSGRGHVAVIYQHCAIDALVCPAGLKVFEGAGEPEVSFSTLDVPQLVLGVITTAIQDTGRLLMAWVRPEANGRSRLWVRLFSFQGASVSSPLSVAESRLIFQGQVRAIANDRFVVSWGNDDGNGLVSFFAALCESPSLSCSAPVTIALHQQAPNGFQFEMNHLGRGLATWATQDSTGAFSGHMVTVNAGVEQ